MLNSKKGLVPPLTPPSEGIITSNYTATATACARFTENTRATDLVLLAKSLCSDLLELLLDQSCFSMLPNYVALPSGSEHGHYLCIDLGGLTLRVAVVYLPGRNESCSSKESTRKEYSVGSSIIHEFKSTKMTPQSNESTIPPNLSNNASCPAGTSYAINFPPPPLIQQSRTILPLEYSQIHLPPLSAINNQDLVPIYPEILIERQWSVGSDHKVVDAEFFEMIASRVNSVLKLQSYLDLGQPILTGLTWLFPLESRSHNSALMIGMGKGYSLLPQLEKADLKQVLEDTMWCTCKVQLNVRLVINDTLAVLTAASYMDPLVQCALVLGTGLNMCCALAKGLESRARLLNTARESILYNTEMSLFGQHMVPSIGTIYDQVIDSRMLPCPLDFKLFLQKDPLLGTYLQPLEHMLGGRYLPELARLVICDLAAKKELFCGASLDMVHHIASHPYDGFTGKLLCFISELRDPDAIVTEWCLAYDWPQSAVSLDDARCIKHIVDSIISRAAFVVATAIIALLSLVHQCNGPFATQTVSIGYDGLVLENFGFLRQLILLKANQCQIMIDMGINIKFKSVQCSSIIGAAIGAAFFS